MAKAKIVNLKPVKTAAVQQERCLCISVEMGTYGQQRKLDLSKVETAADKRRIRASKAIMESANLDAIKTKWRQAHNWLGTKCLPGPFRRGVYICPDDLTAEVDQKLKQFEIDAQPYIDALVAELPALKEADKEAFKDHYNESDYPTEAELRDAFYIEVQYVDFKVSERLKTLAPALYARQVAQDQQRWDDAIKQAREFLRDTALYLLGQFAKQLRGTTKDGKRNPIYDQTINNLRQFAKDFPARNIAGDDRLLLLIARAKGVLGDMDASDFRDDEKVRSRVSKEIDRIESEMNGLMETPLRAIELA
jgi:hypothetical protein